MSGVSPAHLPPGVPRAPRAVIGPWNPSGPAPRSRVAVGGAREAGRLGRKGCATCGDPGPPLLRRPGPVLPCPALPCPAWSCSAPGPGPAPAPTPWSLPRARGWGKTGGPGCAPREIGSPISPGVGAPRPSLPYTEPSVTPPRLATWGHFGPPGEEHVAAPHSWSALTCARPSRRVGAGRLVPMGLGAAGRPRTYHLLHLWGMDPPSRRPQVSSFPGTPPPPNQERLLNLAASPSLLPKWLLSLLLVGWLFCLFGGHTGRCSGFTSGSVWG